MKALFLKTVNLLVLCLFIASCNGSVPLASEIPTPEITPVLVQKAITTINTASISEITQLTVQETSPIASLKFTPDMNELRVAYSDEGTVRAWDITNSTLLRAFEVGPLGLGGAAFDASGDLLATSAGSTWKRHRSDPAYWGWKVWNTQTGGLIKEFGEFDANRPKNSQLQFFYPDILLSPDGRWVFAVEVNGKRTVADHVKSLETYDLLLNTLGEMYVNFSRESEEDDFDVIAFDAQGEFFAAADELGKVAVFPFRPPDYPIDAQAIVEKPKKEVGLKPLALAFDSSRRWLAGIRGTELIVWDLQSSGYKRQVEVVTGDIAGITASLAFDPSGTLLGVGTANGWQIWDVNNKTLLAEGKDVEVYAVTFSPDGRLFAWGDSNGVVHIWGIADN